MKQSKKIQKKIVAAASEFLREQEKFCSWGAEKIKIEETNLSFWVSGFKFCGTIRIITYSENCYNIVLKSPNYEKVIENVTLTEIVEVIDNEIEKTDSYVETLLSWIF